MDRNLKLAVVLVGRDKLHLSEALRELAGVIEKEQDSNACVKLDCGVDVDFSFVLGDLHEDHLSSQVVKPW